MIREHRLAIPAALLALTAATPAFARPAPPPMPGPVSIAGTWVNPRGTVAVRTQDCSGEVCGWVSWANPTALDDAASAGIPHLVGTELLRNYRVAGTGRWTGRVYVPDMGRSFQSTIEQLDAGRLKISGCILGGLFCKSQIWRRS